MIINIENEIFAAVVGASTCILNKGMLCLQCQY